MVNNKKMCTYILPCFNPGRNEPLQIIITNKTEEHPFNIGDKIYVIPGCIRKGYYYPINSGHNRCEFVFISEQDGIDIVKYRNNLINSII